MRKSVLLLLALVLAAWSRVSAQIVSVEVAFEQDQFLPGESIVAAVKITNRSGQQLHLGADAGWLEFSIESMDGFVVKRSGNPSVIGAFDLESSQMGTKKVELANCFDLKHTGRYKVTATLHIREWSKDVMSKPVSFDVIHGAKLWEQNFGMPATAGHPPEVRKFVLDEANYLRTQIRLYVCVMDDSETTIYKVSALGPMVSFGQPEALVDSTQKLHVLWQSGSSVYAYKVISPAGDVVEQAIYDYIGSRPRLAVDDQGKVTVTGGIPRVHPEGMPMVQSPTDLMPTGH